MTAADADRAKAAEVTQRKPLTALEWLRVTHADTLSGRRIEEALAEARAPHDRLAAAVQALAEAWEDESDFDYRVMRPATAAARLRAVVAATEGAIR